MSRCHEEGRTETGDTLVFLGRVHDAPGVSPERSCIGPLSFPTSCHSFYVVFLHSTSTPDQCWSCAHHSLAGESWEKCVSTLMHQLSCPLTPPPLPLQTPHHSKHSFPFIPLRMGCEVNTVKACLAFIDIVLGFIF